MKQKTKSMSKINLDKMSLTELVDLEAKVQKAIAQARGAEANELRKKWAAEAQSRGLSMADMLGTAKGGRGAAKGKKSVGVAKYANPENKTDTWTGRGRKPNWVVERLKKGAKLSDFAI